MTYAEALAYSIGAAILTGIARAVIWIALAIQSAREYRRIIDEENDNG